MQLVANLAVVGQTPCLLSDIENKCWAQAAFANVTTSYFVPQALSCQNFTAKLVFGFQAGGIRNYTVGQDGVTLILSGTSLFVQPVKDSVSNVTRKLWSSPALLLQLAQADGASRGCTWGEGRPPVHSSHDIHLPSWMVCTPRHALPDGVLCAAQSATPHRSLSTPPAPAWRWPHPRPLVVRPRPFTPPNRSLHGVASHAHHTF